MVGGGKFGRLGFCAAATVDVVATVVAVVHNLLCCEQNSNQRVEPRGLKSIMLFYWLTN